MSAISAIEMRQCVLCAQRQGTKLRRRLDTPSASPAERLKKAVKTAGKIVDILRGVLQALGSPHRQDDEIFMGEDDVGTREAATEHSRLQMRRSTCRLREASCSGQSRSFASATEANLSCNSASQFTSRRRGTAPPVETGSGDEPAFQSWRKTVNGCTSSSGRFSRSSAPPCTVYSDASRFPLSTADTVSGGIACRVSMSYQL